MNRQEYISELNRQYQTGQAREHSYRPALQQLLATKLPQLVVTNEPARSQCGAPDFILMRQPDNLPLAFVEAKDINDNDLDGRNRHKEQFDRYKSSLDHIVFTDYLDFHLYEYGEWVENVRIGEWKNGKIHLLKDQQVRFEALLLRLANATPQPVTSAKKLAWLMASKARLLAEVIKATFKDETASSENRQLQSMFNAFRQVLIKDLSPERFADIYAQTIAYGMFAARLHDPTPETFSRQEAATLIPKTNPFLRKIFQGIAGYDLDERIDWIVDDLVATFRATRLDSIMYGYNKKEQRQDPLIHFYEDFLKGYDPQLRKSCGVWYTPLPIVIFIVRSVDELLQREFSLPAGLADYSLVKREVMNLQYEKRRKRGGKPTVTQNFHKVQILDPATGTGTFLAAIVDCIHGKFRNSEGMWQSYVEEHLLPRLNGFELLMAPYAVAHLKLDMLLQGTGYVHKKDERLHIFLTNSLEGFHPDTGTIFAQWLSDEANEASRIKRDIPVMVMMGNPPYSGESQNKGEWIMKLMEDYKKEPGGKDDLKERNPKWLNDDYVKFIRMSQYFIEKNGEGIVAFINPHGYLDNPTFRGMRWNLLQTFDAVYVIDLHGNAKKRETAPDGSKDENVFDIMQGVSISFFIKTGRKSGKEMGRVFHYDLWGMRQDKYMFLEKHNFSDIEFKELRPHSPMYFFVPKDFTLEKEYEEGFKVNELFKTSSVGIVTTKDSFLICDSKEEVRQRMKDLIELPEEELRKKYGLKDTRDWSIARAKADIGTTLDESKICELSYRLNDTKFLYYTGTSNGIVAWPRFHSMCHLLHPLNLALVTCRQLVGNHYSHIFVTKHITDDCYISNRTKERGYIFPLYNIITGFAGRNMEESALIPNFNHEIARKIEARLGEAIVPQELFGYIYAVLHSPTYRERYREFLKIDFPRIPYPSNLTRYHALAEKGSRLYRLHLMENSGRWNVAVTYPEGGSDMIQDMTYKKDKVYINGNQYFGNVPAAVWDLYVGGYQPARKWLKDRIGKTLSFSDIRHYQEIITSLENTMKLMEEIDRIGTC